MYGIAANAVLLHSKVAIAVCFKFMIIPFSLFVPKSDKQTINLKFTFGKFFVKGIENLTRHKVGATMLNTR
jgi:hypothetical protein